jgi:hypothetical protein
MLGRSRLAITRSFSRKSTGNTAEQDLDGVCRSRVKLAHLSPPVAISVA